MMLSHLMSAPLAAAMLSLSGAPDNNPTPEAKVITAPRIPVKEAPTPVVIAQAETAVTDTTDAPEEEAAPTTEATDAVALEQILTEPENLTLVFDGESDDAVVEKVVNYLQQLKTLKGKFSQISPSGARSTGSFWLRRPGQIRFDYDDPSPLLVVATQGNVYVQDSDLDQTDFYPIKRTPLRFLLSKNITLDGARVEGVDRGVDSVAVTFASDDEETEGDLAVIFDAPTLALREWVVRDPQNGVTVVTLSEMENNVRVSNRLFRAPDGGGAFINN